MISLSFGVTTSVAIFPKRPAIKIIRIYFFFQERGQYENRVERVLVRPLE